MIPSRTLAVLALAMALGAGTAAPLRATPLEEALQAFAGHFTWDAARQDFVFSDRPGLAALLEPAPETHLATLVACIDDPRPARALLNGEPVRLGVLCYQALRLVAYVEAPDWPGHVGPLATAADRQAARKAWEAALAEGRAVPH